MLVVTDTFKRREKNSILLLCINIVVLQLLFTEYNVLMLIQPLKDQKLSYKLPE